jgi:hypothetical protein
MATSKNFHIASAGGGWDRAFPASPCTGSDGSEKLGISLMNAPSHMEPLAEGIA